MTVLSEWRSEPHGTALVRVDDAHPLPGLTSGSLSRDFSGFRDAAEFPEWVDCRTSKFRGNSFPRPMRFFCTSLKSCNADHCGYLSGRPGSVRRFPHRMSSEAQKVACFLAPLKQTPRPQRACEADVLVSSTSTILPRRALKTFRKMLFMCGLWGGSCVSVCFEASVRGGLSDRTTKHFPTIFVQTAPNTRWS